MAAKGFDSTGSKLTDAVREVEEIAERRLYTLATLGRFRDDLGDAARRLGLL